MSQKAQRQLEERREGNMKLQSMLEDASNSCVPFISKQVAFRFRWGILHSQNI